MAKTYTFLYGVLCIVGVDLGSEYMKMAVVKHGAASAVDIVLNEQTKRKTITYLGFRGDERYLGEDANQLILPSKPIVFLSVALFVFPVLL